MQHPLTEVALRNKSQAKLTKIILFDTLGEAHYVVLSTSDIEISYKAYENKHKRVGRTEHE